MDSELIAETTPNNRDQDGCVWMISFGDLLTLLVCFFLVLTPQISGSASLNPSDQEVSDLAQRQSLGTTLASSVARDGLTSGSEPNNRIEQPRFLLHRIDGEELPGQLRRAWEGLVSNFNAHAVKLRVGLCDVGAYDEVVTAVGRELSSDKRRYGPQIVSREFEVGSDCTLGQVAKEALAEGELLAVMDFEEVLNG